MNRILCGRRYAPQILAILNDAILTSTALWEYAARTPATMDAFFDAKEAGSYPVVGLVDDEDKLLAFGSYGPFRARPAYKYTLEHSVYVAREERGKGLGRVVLEALIELATEQGYHCLVGAIEARNSASIALHEKCGFVLSGTLRQTGFKFGEWLDLSFYQRILDAPAHPVDG